MADKLYEQMEVLEAIKIKGKKMKHEVSDRVLHFFIDYKVHLMKDATAISKDEPIGGNMFMESKFTKDQFLDSKQFEQEERYLLDGVARR